MLFKRLIGFLAGVMDEEPVGGIAEHRKHCTAKPGKCPFERNLDGADSSLSNFRGLNEEDDGVRSYVTKAVKKDGKWVEQKTVVKKNGAEKSTRSDHDSGWGKKGAHEKWYRLPPPSESKETPSLDSFSSVPAIPATKMSEIADALCYLRGAKNTSGTQPAYQWTKGGDAVPQDEAIRLEGALREGKHTGALNEDYSEVKVRPDLFNGTGQMASFKNKDGKPCQSYCADHKIGSAVAKYNNVLALEEHYEDIKKKICEDCVKGKQEAILAYAMMRTKIRVGSSAKPTDGQGLRHLTKGDIQLSQDGETLYFSFNGKSSQWWHVTLKDKFLHEYVANRKASLTGAGSNTVPVFDVSYGDICNYLHDISREYVNSDDEAMDPHDFRRIGATRLARQYLKKELNGVSPTENRKKWEDRIVKAVYEVAGHLNDTPRMVFSSYIAPQVLFESSMQDMVNYFPFLAN